MEWVEWVHWLSCDWSGCRNSSTQSASDTRFVGIIERVAAGGSGTRSRGATTTHDGKTTVIRTVHAESSELGRLPSWGTASLCNVGGLSFVIQLCMFVTPPRRFCVRSGLCVCLCVSAQNISKSDERILMKFFWRVEHGSSSRYGGR